MIDAAIVFLNARHQELDPVQCEDRTVWIAVLVDRLVIVLNQCSQYYYMVMAIGNRHQNVVKAMAYWNCMVIDILVRTIHHFLVYLGNQYC